MRGQFTACGGRSLVFWVGRVDDGATGNQLTITADQILGTRDKRQDLGAGMYQLDLTKIPWQMDATRTRRKKGREVPGDFRPGRRYAQVVREHSG